VTSVATAPDDGRGTSGRQPLFCDTALAERIERAEADLIARSSRAARERSAGTAGFVTPLAGGVASFAEADSPFNKVAGLGFGGVPGADELDQVERAFAARGAPVQVELAVLADPAIGALLTGRGYRLESFENVLGRALAVTPGRVAPPGIDVRRSDAEDFGPWLGVVADAATQPDSQGLPEHEEFPREAVARAERDLVAAGAVRYTAHSARIQVPAERAAPGLRPALLPRHPGPAALSQGGRPGRGRAAASAAEPAPAAPG
jgi:hypothetical protein